MRDKTTTHLSPSEAGRQLGVSTTYIRMLVSRGKLKAERTPLGRIVDAEDVRRLRAEREANPPRPGRKGSVTIDRQTRSAIVLPAGDVTLRGDELLIHQNGDEGRTLLTGRCFKEGDHGSQ